MPKDVRESNAMNEAKKFPNQYANDVNSGYMGTYEEWELEYIKKFEDDRIEEPEFVNPTIKLKMPECDNTEIIVTSRIRLNNMTEESIRDYIYSSFTGEMPISIDIMSEKKVDGNKILVINPVKVGRNLKIHLESLNIGFQQLDEESDIYFTNTHWQKVSKLCTDAIIRSYLHLCGKEDVSLDTKMLDSCLRQFRDLSRGGYPTPNRNYLNMSNGVYDLMEDKLYTHDQKYNFMYVIDYDVDKSASSDKWNKFLKNILIDDDLIRYLQIILGSALTPNRAKKALLFDGDGANGKSTLCEVISAATGGNINNSGVSIDQMLDEKGYWGATMIGKTYNIATENTGKFTNADIYKQVVSKESCSFRPIGKEPIWSDDWPLIICCVNKFIVTNECNRAFKRRTDIIPFSQTFEGKNDDPNLLETLIKEHLPSVLNWLIEGAIEWERLGHKVDRPRCLEESMKDYWRYVDSVQSFLDEMDYKPCDKTDGLIMPLVEFHRMYTSFCNDEASEPVKYTEFRNSLAKRKFQLPKPGNKAHVRFKHSDPLS